jgi:anion transporter
VCLGLWFAPIHEQVTAQRAIAIAAFIIILFITEPVDHAVAGLMGIVLFWAAGVAAPDVVFSGFAVETPWFLLGALLIGAMAGKSGLARRLAYTVTAKVGTSYPRVLFGFIVVDFLLTFLVPSGIARVTLLGTIAIGVIDAFKVPRKSNIGRGLLIIITYSAGIYDKMLIAGATSILARGIIQNFTGTPILYSHWFIAYLPCDLLTILACQFLILRMYPPEKRSIEDVGHLQRQVDQLGPWQPAEKRCAIFLALAVILWMTDFIHHLSPALVGISVGLLGLMPGIGILEPNDVRKLHFGALWFTGAALSMGRILQETGGLSILTDTLTWWMQPLVAIPFAKSMVLYWTGFTYHFFLANETAMLSTSLPIVLQFAVDNGLPPLSTGMIWTFSAGAKIFVYQSAVLIVGYSFGCFEAKDMLKVGFALSVVEAINLFLLVNFYWPLIGLV